MNPVAYIRRHPFSVMALCCIFGDLCYLGFAFAALGLVSIPKLAGALFTLSAHIISLAYSDTKPPTNVSETDYAGRILIRLRALSCLLLSQLPQQILHQIRGKPIGISFAMLGLNGTGLFIDAINNGPSAATLSQTMLGFFIMLGCGAYSLADYVKDQKQANFLLKFAPIVLMLANTSGLALAATTRNGFIICSCVVFFISSLAGFYTKIDKTAVRVA